MTTGDPAVLVVEDEAALLDIYEQWLDDDYDVRTATSGEEALERLDDAVEVILLDRLMPGMSGTDVLAAIRERVASCRVAMVTAMEPDFDILRMGFDDYLTKPVDREELVATIEKLLARGSFADHERELFALASKRAALAASKSRAELEDNEAFAELETRIEELLERADEAVPPVDDESMIAMVREAEEDAPDPATGREEDAPGDATGRDG